MCKIVRIYRILEFFFNGKISWTGGADTWRGIGARCASAQGHRCLPALAEKDEEGETEPEVCSLEHERQQGGVATVAKGFASRVL
jgi:hypothetical protein